MTGHHGSSSIRMGKKDMTSFLPYLREAENYEQFNHLFIVEMVKLLLLLPQLVELL